jgi:hypothetical protein
VGAWWKYITSKVGQQKPTAEAEVEDEPERAETANGTAGAHSLVGSKV